MGRCRFEATSFGVLHLPIHLLLYVVLPGELVSFKLTGESPFTKKLEGFQILRLSPPPH